jgi:hypothetical protein
MALSIEKRLSKLTLKKIEKRKQTKKEGIAGWYIAAAFILNLTLFLLPTNSKYNAVPLWIELLVGGFFGAASSLPFIEWFKSKSMLIVLLLLMGKLSVIGFNFINEKNAYKNQRIIEKKTSD